MPGDEVSTHAVEGGSLNQQGAIHVEEPTGTFASQPAGAGTLNFVAKSSDHKESGMILNYFAPKYKHLLEYIFLT